MISLFHSSSFQIDSIGCLQRRELAAPTKDRAKGRIVTIFPFILAQNFDKCECIRLKQVIKSIKFWSRVNEQLLFFTVFTLPGSPLLYNSLRKISSQEENLNLANNLLRSQSYQKVVLMHRRFQFREGTTDK